jgi:hypothetical protein
MNNWPLSGHSSEASSNPIDINNNNNKVIPSFARIYNLSHTVTSRVLVLAYRNLQHQVVPVSDLFYQERLFPITVSVLPLSQAIRGTDLHLLKKAQRRILGYYGDEPGPLPRDMPATKRRTPLAAS